MQASSNDSSTAVIAGDCKLDVAAIKADFPILHQQVNGKPLIYLDSAASSQKPQAVIDAVARHYQTDNANIHRGLHTLADRSTQAYERVRSRVCQFIGGADHEEIIFTSGTTASINLIAHSWGDENISEGDEIVITEMEHHANLVPWIMLAKRRKAVLKRIPITPEGRLDIQFLDKIITAKTKVVAFTHMSNVLGVVNPVKDILAAARKYGAMTVVDGAQAAPHLPVDVKELDADFYAFSAHKMLGPTGVGVLHGKREALNKMPPFMTGGEMIREVTFENATWADLPHKFEPGTPNIADVVAFEAALDYLDGLGWENIGAHEAEITRYALKRLGELDGLKVQGPTEAVERGSVISFTDPRVHPHDIGTFLDSRGIAVRAGHHCAQPLMKTLGTIATARASFYIYNDKQDVDALVEALGEMRRYFGR
jgi:cysteine desulfurase/selenocysteine lyase